MRREGRLRKLLLPNFVVKSEKQEAVADESEGEGDLQKVEKG